MELDAYFDIVMDALRKDPCVLLARRKGEDAS